MKYREITAADDAAVAALVRQRLEQHHLDMPGTAYTDPYLDHLSEYYKTVEGAYYILTDDEDQMLGCIGFSKLDAIPDCAELQKLYLKEDAEGRGLGYELIHIVEKEAAARGFTKLYLETHTNLAAAIHIYEQSGFIKVPQPEWLIHTTMNTFMVKDL